MKISDDNLKFPTAYKFPTAWGCCSTPKHPQQYAYGLDYGANIRPVIAVLTKEPEMLQPDAFCEHTMQQTATGATPRGPQGSLQRSPDPLAGLGALHGRGRQREKRDRKGGEGDVDSDVQLEKGCRLAKAGPEYTE